MTRPPLTLALCGTLAALLLGCAATPHAAQQARSAQRSDALQRSAYAPQAQGLVQARADSLRSPLADSERLSLLLPAQGQALPVIVYLPGLGESAQAGLRWRERWARAGHAVLGLQPLQEDAGAWRSELARAAEFRTLTEQRHAPAVRSAQLEQLFARLDELQARARAGEAPWSRLDWQHIVLAGYELGAGIALDALHQQPQRFRAAVLLSPEGAPQRQSMTRASQAPVLCISSDRDEDPSGWMPSAADRERLCQILPSAALLKLQGASHAQLSGHVPVQEELAAQHAQAQRQERRMSIDEAQAQQRSRQGGPQRLPDARRYPLAGVHSLAEYEAVIATVSLAFVDAQRGDRPEARRWLDQALPTWAGELAQWRPR